MLARKTNEHRSQSDSKIAVTVSFVVCVSMSMKISPTCAMNSNRSWRFFSLLFLGPNQFIKLHDKCCVYEYQALISVDSTDFFFKSRL